MAAFTAWRFAEAGMADQVEYTVLRLRRQGSIVVDDAASASWRTDERKPRTRQFQSLTGERSLVESFWGLLFGSLFFVPLLADAAAADTERRKLGGVLAPVGFGEELLRRVRPQLHPGGSALFVLGPDDGVAALHDALAAAQDGPPVQALVAPAQEERLHEVFAAE